MKVCVIIGSSNLTGYTYALVKRALSSIEHNLINISHKNINYFDYKNRYKTDQFLECLNEALEAEIIILASPVYWYSVSAQLKTFLDRLTDLVFFEEAMLKKIREKKFAFLSTYSNDAGYGLDVIRKTLHYLEIELIASLVLQNSEISSEKIEEFTKTIKEHLNMTEPITKSIQKQIN